MKAVRLTRSQWLNDAVAGDPSQVKILDDQMAYEAVEVWGIAVYAPELDPVRADAVDQVQPAAPVPAEVQVADFAGTSGEGQQVPETAEAPVRRPYANESKADWITWAVHNGADPQEAAGMTKNELMGRYGERL